MSSSEEDTFYYRGRSMAGTFCPGDSLIVAPALLDSLRPGDVVVVQGPNQQANNTDRLVHRVITATPGGLITRGDNNPCPDATPVTAVNLLGQVTHVQRNGKVYRVRGGRIGLLRARLLRVWRRTWRRAWRLIVQIGRWPYRRLRQSGLAARLWKPSITQISLMTKDGPVIKYVFGRWTVARWWPQNNRFECRKPFDLFLHRPDKPE